jgi:dCTP deaminase
MLLNDYQIADLAKNKEMISPYHSNLITEVEVRSHPDIPPVVRKIISYGQSSFGYDLRLSASEFKIFRHIPGQIVNPKEFNPEMLMSVKLHSDKWGQYFILPSHTYGLGLAMEKLEIPRNITAIFLTKSTYARAGIIWNLTPGEAGWRGHLTLEVSNSSHSDVRIYAQEGVVQALFLTGDPCAVSYDDRKGKYQDQPKEIITSRI